MYSIVKCVNNQSIKWLLVIMIFCCIVAANSNDNHTTTSQQQSIHSNSSQFLSTTTNQQQFSPFIENDDEISENKLLSIQRQIIMNQQMLKLYQQRLQLLYLLRKQLKYQLVKKNQQYLSKKVDSNVPQIGSDRIKQQLNDRDDNKNSKQHVNSNNNNNDNLFSQSQSQQYQDSPFYILINQFSITTKQQQYHTTVSTSLSSFNKLDQHVILLPPFVINNKQSFVTLIEQIDHFKGGKLFSQQQLNDSKMKAYYDFSHASRLLFYSLQKGYNNKKQSHHHQNYQQPYDQQQPHTLQLTLQIKPNKIKIVKITPFIIKTNQTLSSQTTTTYKNIFQIQQQVTSYQSHPFINKNFKWHNGLQFDNLIIGYNDKKIYIKGKDKKMQEINVNQKILGLYSINQYKVVYVTQKRVGTINVRSYLLSDQIRFQYYLGNRTLIKKQKQSPQQQQQHLQQQLNILFNNQLNNNKNNNTLSKPYWHASYSKQFKQINAVSIQRIQRTNQMLILLSNGDLLMYGNNKILSSVNIGVQVMREFVWDVIKNDDVNGQGEKKGDMENKFYYDDDGDMKIHMQILPGYNHAILTSTKHNKILIYNITIPHLTVNKNSNFFAFLSPKAQQLTFQYWTAVEMNKLTKRDSQNKGQNVQNSKMNRFSSNDVKVFVRQKNYRQSFGEVGYGGNMGKQVIVYFAYYVSSLDEIKSNNPQHQQQSSSPTLTTTTTIQQHRLLLNLLQSNHLTPNTANNNSSETKSYWWNVLMICMIVVGVVVFKKCKQSNKSKSQQQQQYNQLYQLPQGYKMGKSMKSNDNSKLLTTTAGRLTKDNKINKPIIRQQQQFTQTQQYQDKVIAQLQLYLQKQGQKLTKEQISQLIQQMETKQEQDQGQMVRPKMRRQTSGDDEQQQYGKEDVMPSSSMRKNDKKRLIQQKQRKQTIKIDSLQKKKKKRQ